MLIAKWVMWNITFVFLFEFFFAFVFVFVLVFVFVFVFVFVLVFVFVCLIFNSPLSTATNSKVKLNSTTPINPQLPPQ